MLRLRPSYAKLVFFLLCRMDLPSKNSRFHYSSQLFKHLLVLNQYNVLVLIGNCMNTIFLFVYKQQQQQQIIKKNRWIHCWYKKTKYTTHRAKEKTICLDFFKLLEISNWFLFWNLKCLVFVHFFQDLFKYFCWKILNLN